MQWTGWETGEEYVRRGEGYVRRGKHMSVAQLMRKQPAECLAHSALSGGQAQLRSAHAPAASLPLFLK